MHSILEAARAAYAAGLAPVPTSNTGSKAPDVARWKAFQVRRPSPDEMRAFDFAAHDGLGIIAGVGSGCREAWDYDGDAIFGAFVERAQASGLGALVDRLISGYLDATPGGGRRIIVSYPPDLTFKDCTLARRPGRPGEPAIKTLIELPTFAIVAPSNGRTHPSGKAYERLAGDFSTIAAYTVDERAALLTLARTFDEMPRAEARPSASSTGRVGTRPGDDYNRRTTWPQVIGSHRWTFVFDRDAVGYWRRPDKATGISATTNYGGSDLLYVFSSSTPFDPDKSYTRFGAYAVLEHGGDFGKAALALFKEGYGDNDTREVSREPAAGAADGSTSGAARSLRLTPASTITVQPVTWLWQDRLPVGVFALVGGREGVGKSILTYSVAADITNGTLHGAYAGTPRGVIVCATEDSWAHTITPRLMAAGADLSRIFRADILDADGFELPLSLPKDTAALARGIAESDTALVIFDPLLSRLDARLDSHKDADVRRALEPLAALADSAKVSIVGLVHVNKSASTDALTLLMASRAFTAVARSVLFVTTDPDDDRQRQVFMAKNNLGRMDVPTLVFTIGGTLVATTVENEEVWTGKLTWAGTSDQSLREVLERVGERGDDAEARDEAEAWLCDYLKAQGGTAAKKDVVTAARRAGHSERTLTRARQHAGIETDLRGFPCQSYWLLPSGSRTASEAESGHIPSESGPTGDGGPTWVAEVQLGHDNSVGPPIGTSPHRGLAGDGGPTDVPNGSYPSNSLDTAPNDPQTEGTSLSERIWQEADARFKKGWQTHE